MKNLKKIHLNAKRSFALASPCSGHVFVVSRQKLIIFHKNGIVLWGTLAKEATLEGKTYYYNIGLDENGKVISGE